MAAISLNGSNDSPCRWAVVTAFLGGTAVTNPSIVKANIMSLDVKSPAPFQSPSANDDFPGDVVFKFTCLKDGS
jgi:hypothetical protein